MSVVHELDSSSDSSDSEVDDTETPDSETCLALVDSFVEITNTDVIMGQMFLQKNRWSLENAVDQYFKKTRSRQNNDEGEVVVSTTKPPDHFSVVSWNTDGISEKNLRPRTLELCKLIKQFKITVVFLQEVVEESLSLIKQHLEAEYMVLQDIVKGQKVCHYFTITLMRRYHVYVDAVMRLPFESSSMGRDMLIVEAHIGKLTFSFINVHLESTKEFVTERKRQVSKLFEQASTYLESSSIVIFGGDMNARDSEIKEIFGSRLPNGIEDLWEMGGSKDSSKYTWDMQRNTNLEFPGKFKPKCRFDRLFFLARDQQTKLAKLNNFNLFGVEKVKGTQSFVSDHWAIFADFHIKSD